MRSMAVVEGLNSARLWNISEQLLLWKEAPGWPALYMMTHGSCDRAWLICGLCQDNANQTGRPPACIDREDDERLTTALITAAYR